MFNSNLTSSLSGWFTNKFQANEEEEPAINDEAPKQQDEENVTKTVCCNIKLTKTLYLLF